MNTHEAPDPIETTPSASPALPVAPAPLAPPPDIAPDPRDTPVVTDGIAPKTFAAAGIGAVLGIATALLNSLQASPVLLGAMAPWAQWILLVVIPTVIAGVGTYMAPAALVRDAETGSLLSAPTEPKTGG